MRVRKERQVKEVWELLNGRAWRRVQGGDDCETGWRGAEISGMTLRRCGRGGWQAGTQDQGAGSRKRPAETDDGAYAGQAPRPRSC